MPPKALLAIRSDIEASVEQEYLEWLTREHTIERVSIDGFMSARIFRSQQSGFGRYFILYELADSSVVDSPAYLERLNNPTPWTIRMMPHLGNFVRGGGAITAAIGAGYGASMVPILSEAGSNIDDRDTLKAFVKAAGIVAARIMETDSDRSSVATSEKGLRSGDRSFGALLIIEGLDELVVRRVVSDLTRRKGALEEDSPSEFLVYSQIFQLTR
ncbi:hypothetical protein [Pseudorhodoplanes sp.]|uniref:hypothetical protein n=1 Tax=Pseudorhodoplanes sp. TaxID=1934341 RepID=UPI002CBB27A9|nr:hypothetical protein [Pseudorhodoplanes sp.]HWV55479.1 hypothetical protein [Pseudorhodoplanes sp.]